MAGSSSSGQVLVVHCIDTEGPIGGDVRRRPDGSKEFMDNWADIKNSLQEITCPEFRQKYNDSSGNPIRLQLVYHGLHGLQNQSEEQGSRVS